MCIRDRLWSNKDDLKTPCIISSSFFINISTHSFIKVFIDNALKYGSNIEIKIDKIKKNIFVYIDDNGTGIPTSEYENVFKPFYKIDKSRSDAKSSVGLGLSIALDIVKSHGGNIELGKSNLGGLKVKITLPI